MPIQSTCKLIVAAKDGTVVKTVDLTRRRTLTIGRSPRCDLSMDLESISRRHATMVLLNGRWTMIDNDSKTGFKVDNEKHDVAGLADDRPIQLGGAFFWLQTNLDSQLPSTKDSSQNTLWIPPEPETGKVNLNIMDLEARPLHQISADGELTTIGRSDDCDFCVPLDGWSPVQLAVIQSASGTSILDVSAQSQMRIQGISCRRWSKRQSSLIRCGDQLLQIEIEDPLQDRVDAASDDLK